VFPGILTSIEPYASKLKGYLGMKADIVIRFQVNANKFQAGRYILAFCPTLGHNSVYVQGTKFAHLTTITQLPHVQIDINTQTEAILRIPYVSVFSHLPIVSPSILTGVLGIARIFPYSAIVSVAGSNTASYDIYAHFENVELAAPCVPQSGKFRVKNNTTEEQKSKGVGPLEGAMMKVAKVSNLIGEKVPSLSALAFPLAWASDLAAGVASVFGWSKPTNLGAANRMQVYNLPYLANCDVIDNSMPISLFSTNQVEVLPGFGGTDIDEHSISYLVSKPAFTRSFSWSTSSPVDQVLYQQPISPESWGNSFLSNGATVYALPPINFLSSFFAYYKGGIRVTFKVVKTEFHSGRIAVTFNPASPLAPATYSGPTTNSYVLREIIDIREGTNFDLIIPYVSVIPYRLVDEVFGSLQVTVVNPLIAPATVSSTIVFLVEVAGAPDFEFAVPNQKLTFTPVTVFNPQSSTFIPKADVDSITSNVIGNSTISSDGNMSARACIGEKIVSILSLLKRYELWVSSAGITHLLLDPGAISLSKTVTPTNNLNGTVNKLDLFSLAFAVSRGSYRFKSIHITDDSSYLVRTAVMYNVFSGSYNGPTIAANSARSRNPPIVAQTSSAGAPLEIQVPQYTQGYGRVISSEIYIQNDTPKLYDNPLCSKSQLIITQKSSVSTDIYRSVGDDFQLGYFIGFPLVVIRSDYD